MREVCAKFFRTCPESARLCQASDIALSEGLNISGQLRIATCRNGLVDGTTPIIVNGRQVANLWIGQVFFEPPDLEHFRRQGQAYGYDLDAYLEAIDKVPIVPRERFELVLRFLSELAGTIAELGQQRIRDQENTRRLEESEAKYRTLAENTNDIIYATDAEGRLRYASPQVAQYGYTADAIVNRHLLEMVRPEDRERVAADFQRTMATGQEFPTCFRLTDKQGRDVWFEDRGKVQRDKTGRVTGLFGVLRNITERKQAEDALRESEEKYRQLFATEKNAILVADLSSWTILDANESAWQMYGYSREEFLRLTLWDITAEKEKTHEALNAAQRNGHVFVGLRRHRRKDGSIFLVEISTNSFCASGRSMFCNVIRDITERKQVEEALLRSEAKFRALAEGIPGVVYSVPSAEGMEKFYVSPQVKELLGFTCEDYAADGDLWRKQVHPEDRDRVLGELERSIRAGVPFISEYRFFRKDGQMRWLHDETRTMMLKDQTPVRQGVILDITDRKQSEQALRDSEEKYRQLFTTETDSLVMFDAQTYEMLDVNESALRLYGYTREEFLALTCWDMTVEPEETLKSKERLLARGFDQVSLRYHRKKDGTVFPMEFSGVRFTLGDRTVFSIAVRDITERMRAEADLRQSEDNFRSLVEGAPEALFVQSQGRFAYLNPAMLKLLGASRPEELLGTNFMERMAPEYHEVIRKRIRYQKESGQPSGFMDQQYVRLDGSRVPVETTAVAMKYQGRDAHLVFVRDITERQRTEAALSESEQRFRTLFEKTTEGILLVDPKTKKFNMANPRMCEMLGYLPEEISNLSVRDLLGEEDLPRMMKEFEKHVRNEIAGSEDIPVKRKDGSVFYADIRSFRVTLNGASFLAGLFRDATARRAAAEQNAWYQERLKSLALELSLAEERERRRLAAHLHDQILQILAVIQMKLTLARSEEPKAATDRDAFLQEISALVARTLRSCRSLTLQMSHPALYDLGFVAAVEWLADDIQALHGLKVTLKDDGLPKPIEERTRVVLFQSLRELLVNVAKHAGVDLARVRLALHNSTVRVTVRDKGTGFDPSAVNLRHHRDHFGLFSIRERLDHLGGQVDIRSAPGQGTTITMTVPLSVGPAGAVEEKP